jgi:PAS domain S-box-containing protein
MRFVPDKNTLSGRLLLRLGKILGLRSETVYSRAIVLTAISFVVIGSLSVGAIWLFMFRQFNLADIEEAKASASAVKSFLHSTNTSESGPPSVDALKVAGTLLGRSVTYRELAGAPPKSGIAVQKIDGGIVEASFPWSEGTVVVSGRRSFYEKGSEVARFLLAGLTVVSGLLVLLILFIVDRTILGRIQTLSDKVEGEKDAKRLPVKLDFSGEDELAQMARSIEELATLVQAAEREYRNVVEDQIESICRFDRSGHITFFNKSFVEMSGYDKEAPPDELQKSVDRETLMVLLESLEQLTPDSPVTSFTHQVRRNAQASAWFRSTLRGIFNKNGYTTGGQWIAADVTTEVHAQKKLQDSQQQLQVLSARLMSLQDQERRRIARDLHDSTAQSLSALEMNLSVLESLLVDEKSRKLAADTRAISRQVCAELRNISYLLHPPLLEEQGLVFAIRWFADGFTKRNGIPVFLDLPEKFPRLSPDEETALFRIVQEALSNIYRHAGATKAWITLRRGDDHEISLEIRDNGEGLPEGFSFAGSVGVGLAGMRERMKQLGGNLEVDSSPYGVSVRCKLKNTTTEQSPLNHTYLT